ncbi:MAG: FixH family protein [Bacteroidetes bacterium]|jgi:hypothetical protein|nr:FixH family protein [Bacteroidota bacterium]
MKSIFKMLALAGVIAFTFSCKKNNTAPDEETNPTSNPTSNLIQIGETYIIGANAKAIIYSAKPFETGYNVVYVALFDSTDGSRLSAGHFNINPMMDMGMMQHSCPVENTADTTTTDNYFKTAVVFSMPGTASEWSLNLNFHNHKNGLEGSGTLGVNVISSSPARFKSTVLSLDSNSSVLISLVGLLNPQVGINDFEITLHKKASMMSFPAIDNYSVEIIPEMPSMGHGSPNNVNPILTSNGHYVGKVNFTMTGLWRINLKLYKNGTLISSDQYFETTLQ